MIKVVGIGCNKGDMTQNGLEQLKKAQCVATRTNKSAAAKALAGYSPISMDEYYNSAKDFDELNEMIINRLLELEKEYFEVLYCVDGDGFSDGTVIELMKSAEVQIIAGVSEYRGKVPTLSVLTMSAYDVCNNAYLDTSVALYIKDIDNSFMAGQVKLYLLEFYGAETICKFSIDNKNESITLEDLDRQKKYDYSCAVFIEGCNRVDKPRYCLGDLIRIMTRLTDIDGCPWDKEQTHESIRINVIEEAYEVVDAIDSGDLDNIIEELGDLMLQSIFHIDIAKRSGEFTFNDVISGLCKKLFMRHTHIFGENKAGDSGEALAFWEKAKAAEKHTDTISDQLQLLPKIFPAALRSEKALKKISKTGWKIDENILKNKLKELLTEIDGVNAKLDIGKFLLLGAALANLYNVDGEVALLEQTNKFIEKFIKLESENNITSGKITEELLK